MKRRSFLQLALALTGIPFLPKAAAKPALPPLHPHDPFCGAGELGNIPVGTIQPFAGSGAPKGWLPCDGRHLSPGSYPELFNAIGSSYSPFNPTFQLPDLNARMHAVPDDADRPDLCGWHGEIIYSGVQHIIKVEP
jgi:Phage Tail Collar Domain